MYNAEQLSVFLLAFETPGRANLRPAIAPMPSHSLPESGKASFVAVIQGGLSTT